MTTCPSVAAPSSRGGGFTDPKFTSFAPLGDDLLPCWLDTFSPLEQRIHSPTKSLMLALPSNSFLGGFIRLAEDPLAFKSVEHLLIDGMDTPYESRQFPCIRWFGHLRNSLKSLVLDSVAVNPRIIAAFPRLEFLFVRVPRTLLCSIRTKAATSTSPISAMLSRARFGSTSTLGTSKQVFSPRSRLVHWVRTQLGLTQETSMG